MQSYNTSIFFGTDSHTSPQFTAQPASIIVATARSATLQCGTTGEPAPTVVWYGEEGGPVHTGGSISVSSAGELVISGVSLSDDGKYYCVASNAVGSVRSLSTALDIAGKN